ncbi:MAG TPA: RNA polymerase factor sigma-54 [Methylomirabilota bacterium]|jgi:RNA polymerase sigma-54 factor|nr:RNA polymerase factor sigma-54 [Methylomirabilota bacterium]
MAMEARLTLRQTQRLVMTPMLQQAIQLLQLSTIELQELLQKELTENPMLEESPTEEGPAPEPPADQPAAEVTPPDAPAVAETVEAPELPFDITEIMFGPPEERTLVQQEEHEETRFENFVGTTTSLADHLYDQLRLSVAEPEVQKAGEEIIGNLDEDGYLRATLAEMAEKTSLPLGTFEAALALVQTFDPPGVAARDLRECLLIQLRQQEGPDPLAVEILESQFEAFQRCKYAEIARALKRDPDRIQEAVEEIAGLEPKPGRRFAPSDTRYVVPDVHVHKTEDGYAIVLNDDGIPRLRINPYYRSMLVRGQSDEARRYVEDRLRSAIWLIKSVHQRQRTLYRVTDSIVKFQKEFLEHGLPQLRPLSLRDVAEDIGMHESTVSRVTTNKYVQTPQGLFELKFFFHSGIATGRGDMVSSISVKKMIQDLVAQENQQKPLSDQEITRTLKQRGLSIARRTVAKYREELGILPSHQRKLATRKRA